MDLLIAFAVFLAAMAATLLLGGSMILPLLIGLAAFVWVGLRKGFSLKTLAGMGDAGTRDALIVIKVMSFIGFLRRDVDFAKSMVLSASPVVIAFIARALLYDISSSIPLGK